MAQMTFLHDLSVLSWPDSSCIEVVYVIYDLSAQTAQLYRDKGSETDCRTNSDYIMCMSAIFVELDISILLL